MTEAAKVASNPSCQACRREVGARQVLTMKGKRKIWKCQSCIDRKSVSFMSVKDRKIYKR